MSAQAMLLRALRELEPSTLLLIGPEPVPGLAEYVAERRLAEPAVIRLPDRIELGAGARFDVGVIAGVIEAWPTRRSEQVIAAARDQYCANVLLLVRHGQWRLSRYLALGFEQQASSRNGDAYDLFWYHVDRYNPEREWNNPENWANPQNFKRFRW